MALHGREGLVNNSNNNRFYVGDNMGDISTSPFHNGETSTTRPGDNILHQRSISDDCDIAQNMRGNSISNERSQYGARFQAPPGSDIHYEEALDVEGLHDINGNGLRLEADSETRLFLAETELMIQDLDSVFENGAKVLSGSPQFPVSNGSVFDRESTITPFTSAHVPTVENHSARIITLGQHVNFGQAYRTPDEKQNISDTLDNVRKDFIPVPGVSRNPNGDSLPFPISLPVDGVASSEPRFQGRLQQIQAQYNTLRRFASEPASQDSNICNTEFTQSYQHVVNETSHSGDVNINNETENLLDDLDAILQECKQSGYDGNYHGPQSDNSQGHGYYDTASSRGWDRFTISDREPYCVNTAHLTSRNSEERCANIMFPRESKSPTSTALNFQVEEASVSSNGSYGITTPRFETGSLRKNRTRTSSETSSEHSPIRTSYPGKRHVSSSSSCSPTRDNSSEYDRSARSSWNKTLATPKSPVSPVIPAQRDLGFVYSKLHSRGSISSDEVVTELNPFREEILSSASPSLGSPRKRGDKFSRAEDSKKSSYLEDSSRSLVSATPTSPRPKVDVFWSSTLPTRGTNASADSDPACGLGLHQGKSKFLSTSSSGERNETSERRQINSTSDSQIPWQGLQTPIWKKQLVNKNSQRRMGIARNETYFKESEPAENNVRASDDNPSWGLTDSNRVSISHNNSSDYDELLRELEELKCSLSDPDLDLSELPSLKTPHLPKGDTPKQFKQVTFNVANSETSNDSDHGQQNRASSEERDKPADGSSVYVSSLVVPHPQCVENVIINTQSNSVHVSTASFTISQPAGDKKEQFALGAQTFERKTFSTNRPTQPNLQTLSLTNDESKLQRAAPLGLNDAGGQTNYMKSRDSKSSRDVSKSRNVPKSSHDRFNGEPSGLSVLDQITSFDAGKLRKVEDQKTKNPGGKAGAQMGGLGTTNAWPDCKADNANENGLLNQIRSFDAGKLRKAEEQQTSPISTANLQALQTSHVQGQSLTATRGRRGADEIDEDRRSPEKGTTNKFDFQPLGGKFSQYVRNNSRPNENTVREVQSQVKLENDRSSVSSSHDYDSSHEPESSHDQGSSHDLDSSRDLDSSHDLDSSPDTDMSREFSGTVNKPRPSTGLRLSDWPLEKQKPAFCREETGVKHKSRLEAMQERAGRTRRLSTGSNSEGEVEFGTISRLRSSSNPPKSSEILHDYTDLKSPDLVRSFQRGHDLISAETPPARTTSIENLAHNIIAGIKKISDYQCLD